uniref:Uncharacterized protein n=1 Tax=Panagrolaimus davidi TaxID=227884 RepID=A0A914PN90_9BILA
MKKRTAKQLAASKEGLQKALGVRKEQKLVKIKQNPIQKSKNMKSKSDDKYNKLLCKHMRTAKADIRDAKEERAEERRKLMNTINDNKTTEKDKAIKSNVRRAKRHPKPFAELSRSEKCRRRQKVQKIAPGSQITPLLTVEDATRIQMEGNFSEIDMATIKKKVPGVAGRFARNKLKKSIIRSHPQLYSSKVNENREIKFFDFGEMLEHDITTIGVEKLPSNLSIVFSGDYGQQTLKIGYYIVERDKPCSSWKFRLLASIEEKEGYEILLAIFVKSLSSIPKWKEGVTVNGKFFMCKFVLTGDLKFLNMYWGLQCNAATYFCYSCLISQTDLKNGIMIAPPRTKEQIFHDYDTLQELLNEIDRSKSATHIKNSTSRAHQDCHSVKEMPMTKHIEVEETLQGVLHTISGSFCAIMEYAKAIDPACIKELLKNGHVKLQGYNKKLTGNHGKILLNKLADGSIGYSGPAAEIMYIISYIQKYAVARIIDTDEILELQDCIEMFTNELHQEKYKAIYGRSQHVHALTAHVLSFVKKHRSWGLYSDQPDEAIHKVQKQSYERIPVRTENPIDRNQFFIHQTIVRHELLS